MQPLDSKFYAVYTKLLRKYADAASKMSAPDKYAFERRLRVMAHRELYPYVGECVYKSNTQLFAQDRLDAPLRIRARRGSVHSDVFS